MISRWSIDIAYVSDWLHSLDRGSHEQVIAALELLRHKGPALGRPFVDSVAGSKHSNMKELRPGSTGTSELRLLFVFDPRRRAIILVGGDKRGIWTKWYRQNIQLADSRFDEHLRSIGKESDHG